MKQSSPLKRNLGWLALVLALAGVVLALRSRVVWDEACVVARRQLPRLLGMEVGIGRCEIDPLTGSVRLYGLSAYPKGADAPLLAADSAELMLGAVQPFFGSVEISRLRLSRPRLNVDLATPLPPGPASASAGPKKCPLRALDRIEIGEVELLGAQVRVTLPDGRAIELDEVDASWRTRGGVAELHVEGSGGTVTASAQGRPLAVSRLSFEGALDVGGETLEIHRAEADLEDVTLSASGKIDELCEPRLFLDAQAFLPLPRAAKALGFRQPVAGHLWVQAAISGTTQEPTIAADVAGTGVELGRYKPGDFNATLSWTGKDVRLGKLAVVAGEGEVTASGSLRLVAPYPISLQVEAQRAQLGPILAKAGLPGAWVDVFATGSGRVQGQLRPSLELAGDAEMRVNRFQLAARPWDQPAVQARRLLEFDTGVVRGGVRILSDRVELTGVEVATAGSKVSGEVTLNFDPARGLDVRAVGEALDLSDFGHVAELPWSGTGTGTFVVRGPYNQIAVEAGLSLRDLEFWDFAPGTVEARILYADRVLSFPELTGKKGQTPFRGFAELDFRPKVMGTRATVELERGRTQDVIDLVAGLSSVLEVLQDDLQGEVRGGKVVLAGPSETFHADIAVDLFDTTYLGRRVGDGQLRMRIEDGEVLRLLPLALRGPLGTLRAQGHFRFKQELDFTFGGEGLALEEVVGSERARTLGIDGTLTLAEGRVFGDGEVPRVSGRLSSPEVRYGHRPMGQLDLTAEVTGRALHLSGAVFDGVRTEADVTLKAPIPYSGTVALDLKEIRPLLPSSFGQRLSGAVQGEVRASGAFKQAGSTRVDAVLQRLALQLRGDVKAQNEGPIHLAYAGGRWDVAPLTLRGTNTRISAEGWAGPERVDVKVDGTMDLRLVESFVTPIERTGGTVELTAAVGGTMGRPSVVGNARIQNAQLAMRDYPVALRNLSGDVEFSDQTVLIEDVNGILNEGRLSANGRVLLDGAEVKALGATLQLEGVSARASEDLPMVLSGVVELGGSGEQLVLAGGLDVSRVKYEKPLELDAFLKDLGRPRLGSVGGEKPREWLRFAELGVNLLDVQIDNNLAKAQLKGRLKVTGTNASPGLLGVVETVEGSQAFFRGNRFEVRQGTIEFRERDAIESVFDMHADTQVREYQVRLHAFGRTKDPKVILTSEPALSEGDILSLLTLGVTSRDRTDTAAVSYIAADAFLVASGLDRQVQRFLPKQLPVLINPSVHITTGYNELSSQVEPLATLESRLLTEQLKLSMTRPFSGRGTRVNAEYQFENGLSAQAQWDENSEANYPFGNVGFDLKLRWEVE